MVSMLVLTADNMVGVWKEKSKLLSSKATEQVPGSQRGQTCCRYRRENVIACSMPESIFDRFEVIYVQNDAADIIPVSKGKGGHGEEWWRQFCYRLKMAGYDGWLSIEHEDVLLNALEGLQKSVALLKGVMPSAPADFKPQDI